MKKYRYIVVFLLLAWSVTSGAEPVALYSSFAGNVDFQITGATRRIADDPNSCAVLPEAAPSSASLQGIPATATIRAAYLYWAGSGATLDNTVTFQGASVSADRSFAEVFSIGFTDYEFFSGFADVTALVAGSGTYDLSDLAVYTGDPHCASQAVLAGWALLVVYEHASEPLRVINVFDGFDWFRGSRIDLTAGNFQIPAGGCGAGDCKFGVVTWEGDEDNSDPLGGYTENLFVNPAQSGALTNAVNPLNNQFNSTISLPDVAGPPNATDSYGVDIDVYPLSTPTHLSPGDTQATTRYESGGDLVWLSAQVLSVRNTPVADLAVDKSHSGDFTAGQQGVYTLSVTNNGPNDETGTITLTDTLPSGLSFVSATSTDGSWNCSAAGQDVTCTHPGPLAAGDALAGIELGVDVDPSAAPSVTNTAGVSGTAFDNVAANDTDSDPTNVLVPDVSTSTKTVVDVNGGDADPGDVLRYTVTINESNGEAVDGVSVTDTMDSLLENFNVVSIPAGAVDNSTPGSGPLEIDGIDLAGGGSADIVFEASIVSSAAPGDTVDNTANITNPVTGAVTAAPAPTLLVSESQLPSSGVKPLYAYFDTNTLERTVPATETTVTLNGNDGSVALAQSPSTQAALTLGAGDIPVRLCIQRNNSGFWAGRDVTVTLDYMSTGAGGSTGNIGSQTQNVLGGFGGGGWQEVVFNINLASAMTLNAETAIRLTVTNETGNTNRTIELSSLNACTNGSRVELNAETVINVDSVDVYDAAYPGGSIQPVYVPGSTVFVRAVISDPFGSFDISGADVELVDAGGSIAQASAAMNEVDDSGVATKTYEYQYTIPGDAVEGDWTANITAREGTEGTVTDLGVGTFTVGSPNISMLKLVSTISDPVNNASNPKAIPGAIVEYSITVTNMGLGPADADSVVITDNIPADLTLYLGNPADPVEFVDGSPASGLSFTFNNLGDTGDDIDFSNDAGSTFITPSVDADGFDATTPPINFIRITPQGTLNGATGSGDPGFTLRYRGRVR